MNNDFLPRPDFMIEAGEQKKVQRPLFMELLIFLAVYVVACFIHSMVLTGPSMAWVMTGERHDTIMEMAISGNIDFEKLFSFRLSPSSLEELQRVSEAYLLAQVERVLPALNFYKTIL